MQLEIEVDPIDFPDADAIRKALKAALSIWGAYFSRRIAERFKAEGPGWAPRKASADAITAARESSAKSLSEHNLRSKLIKELTRASKRLDRGRGTTASVMRRAAVLKEFDRQASGGEVSTGKKLKQGSKEQAIAGLTGALIGSKGLQKSVAGLRERKARAEIAAAEKVLGRIAGSVRKKQSINLLEVFSSIPWSDVQNEGGVVGHGAHIVARPFMYVTDEDVEVLAEIVTNRLAAIYGAT